MSCSYQDRWPTWPYDPDCVCEAAAKNCSVIHYTFNNDNQLWGLLMHQHLDCLFNSVFALKRRQHQSSTLLHYRPLVREIHQWPVISLTKGQWNRKLCHRLHEYKNVGCKKLIFEVVWLPNIYLYCRYRHAMALPNVAGGGAGTDDADSPAVLPWPPSILVTSQGGWEGR